MAVGGAAGMLEKRTRRVIDLKTVDYSRGDE
jgi:hypothetical protein